MAAGRFAYVLGIIVLGVLMAGVALYGIGDFIRPLPASCADFGGPSALAPPECSKTNVIIYLVALAALGSGVGFLWRRLGQ
ncbi:MAG: hypothetical protein ACREVB_15710 [Burkholderiales bacterium]